MKAANLAGTYLPSLKVNLLSLLIGLEIIKDRLFRQPLHEPLSSLPSHYRRRFNWRDAPATLRRSRASGVVLTALKAD